MVGPFGEVLVMDWGPRQNLRSADSNVLASRSHNSFEVPEFPTIPVIATATFESAERRILARPQSITKTSPKRSDHDIRGFNRGAARRALLRTRRIAMRRKRRKRSGIEMTDSMYLPAAAFDEFHGVEDAAIGEGSNVGEQALAGMLEGRSTRASRMRRLARSAVPSRHIENFQRHAPLEIFSSAAYTTPMRARDALQQR